MRWPTRNSVGLYIRWICRNATAAVCAFVSSSPPQMAPTIMTTTVPKGRNDDNSANADVDGCDNPRPPCRRRNFSLLFLFPCAASFWPCAGAPLLSTFFVYPQKKNGFECTGFLFKIQQHLRYRRRPAQSLCAWNKQKGGIDYGHFVLITIDTLCTVFGKKKKRKRPRVLWPAVGKKEEAEPKEASRAGAPRQICGACRTWPVRPFPSFPLFPLFFSPI